MIADLNLSISVDSRVFISLNNEFLLVRSLGTERTYINVYIPPCSAVQEMSSALRKRRAISLLAKNYGILNVDLEHSSGGRKKTKDWHTVDSGSVS